MPCLPSATQIYILIIVAAGLGSHVMQSAEKFFSCGV